MTLANWRDLAVILLVIEAFFMSLIPGVILFFAVRGMLWIIRKLRAVSPTVQGYFRTAATVSEQASQRVAAPFIATDAKMAQVRRWRQTSISLLQSRKEAAT